MRQSMLSVKYPLVILVLAASLAFAAPGQTRNPFAKSAPLAVAPNFALESLHGETVQLSDFRDRVVLLYFWATWCGPCKIEMPWFVELQNQYGPQGLQIVGISLDENASQADIAEFADSVGASYPILIGNEIVSKAYGGVPALPETFLIGRDGRVEEKVIGLKGKAEIESAIKKALNNGAPATQEPAPENTSAPQPQR
ncbi:MAG: redoxin domain-containing protein [Candidatus Sulfotelmatobacter sp.]